MCTASFVNCMNQFNYFVVSWSIYQSDHKSQMLVAFSSFPPPPSPSPVPRFPYQMVSVGKNSKTEIFRNPHLFHSHVTKT